MSEIQGKSILVRVRARFELSGVDCSDEFIILPPGMEIDCKIMVALWFQIQVYSKFVE